MAELSKQYDPHAHETQIYQKWESAGAFLPFDKAQGKPFVIMLPPPNITGVLHMGHALQDTIMDILIRWHRMQGETVLWLPGTDHAAIATNKVIEKQLAEEGKTRRDVGREEFIRRTEAWYAKTGAEILNQMKRLGTSADWSRNRFTMDGKYYAAVQEAFIEYFQKGYIYRGERIVNWDPKTQTTVSDLEIDWKTEKAPLYTFQYGPFQISTARPETKFGDKYVVMHPDDARYAAYQPGQKLEVEWINGKIAATVIKDAATDPKFGTGVMTITPWHDLTDFEIARRHKLDKEQIIDVEGKLLPVAGEFAGLPIEQARPKIVEKLKDKGLLVSVNENYGHNVALNDRGKGMIEPQVMRQWFMDMGKLKTETIKVAEKEVVKFLPPRWKKHFLAWMRGVQDWNINRQIWLGHRLPVWWKPGTHGTDHEEGNYVVAREKPAGEWQQDPDVLDTWFSSALWPFATLGWPENTEDLKTFYPTSVLVTGRDILYLWVARMIFSGLELMKGKKYGSRRTSARIPFREVFVHPTVLAKNGQRMSKSLGTGVDPLELIDKYGADATRFGLMYQMSYDSQSLKFDEEAIKAARNFANKIWNIARFLESLADSPASVTKGDSPGVSAGSIADRWIEHQLHAVTGKVTQLLQAYKFGEAAHVLHDFVWKDFADWYVEILKVEGSVKVARDIFQQTLVLLHPFMPHLTEVLWTGDRMLIVSEWPGDAAPAVALRGGREVVVKMARLQALVNAVRSARTLLAIPPGEAMTLHISRPPLRAALAALARAHLTSQKTKAMKAFPTSQGETIWLAAQSLTPAAIEQARGRLAKQSRKLQDMITSQRSTLAKMHGQAPAEKVAEKENLVADAEKRLQEVTHSLHLLAR